MILLADLEAQVKILLDVLRIAAFGNDTPPVIHEPAQHNSGWAYGISSKREAFIFDTEDLNLTLLQFDESLYF